MASLQLRSELKSNQHNLSANIIPSIAFVQVHDEYNILVLRDTLLKYVPRYTLIYIATYIAAAWSEDVATHRRVTKGVQPIS